MNSVAAKRFAEPLKWEFCSNGRARSNTIRITLSPGLANDVRLSSDRCEAKGLNTRGRAPVLELCRELVAAHFNPASLLEAWRGETLCLRVRSIGEGVELTFADDEHGTPRLRRRQKSSQSSAVGSPVTPNANGRGAVTASRDGAQSMAPGAQARQRRHPHRIAQAAESADPLLGPEAPGPFGSGSHTDEVAADGIGYGP
jgi:hypothetical protein